MGRKPASEIQADLEPGADLGPVEHSGSVALVSQASSWNVELAADLGSSYLFPSDEIRLIQDDRAVDTSVISSCALALAHPVKLV